MSDPVNCSASELCIFLQELGGGYLPTYYLGINQSAPSKSITIVSKSWQHGKKMGVFPSFQSLAMSQNLMASHGMDSLKLSREASLVQTSPLLGMEKELKVQKAASGLNKPGSLMRWNPSTRTWKTHQLSLLEDLGESLATWSRWGSIVAGEFYPEQPWGRTMRENEFGYLLPTPTAHNAKEGAYPAEYTRKTPTLATHVGGKIHPNFTEWMMCWPQDWSALNVSVMDKFQSWRQQHGRFSADEKN